MKDVNLLDTCYTYFKRVGLKPLLLKKTSSKGLLERKRSSGDIVQGSGTYNRKTSGVAEDQTSVSVSELLYVVVTHVMPSSSSQWVWSQTYMHPCIASVWLAGRVF